MSIFYEPPGPIRECFTCDRVGCPGCPDTPPRSSMTTTIPTTTGPVTVEANTPAPGLITFPAPPEFRPDCPNRWLLAHHDGHVLAAFATEEAADTAAVEVAKVADWTKSVMTAAQQISLGLEGGAPRFLALLKELGGHDPNAKN